MLSNNFGANFNLVLVEIFRANLSRIFFKKLGIKKAEIFVHFIIVC